MLAMTATCVTVFGGNGFLGRAIVKRLATMGTTVRVAGRHPIPLRTADMTATGGQVEPVCADIRDETCVARVLEGCDAAVNAVGLYSERGSQTFHAVHELGALHVARQSARMGVKALVHISGIGADLHSKSSYVRSRASGELLVKNAFPDATILRPSVLFGQNDKFLNSLLVATRWFPVVALFGAGDTRLQPVYVGDVAEAVARVLAMPSSHGKVYELGGPRIYGYRALLELVLKEAGRLRLLIPFPFLAWAALARLLMLLPNPPLTSDVIELMKRDNVVSEDALTFADLGLDPTALEAVLPLIANSRP